MKPVYICDLEGTTGIYSSRKRGFYKNDLILVRSGFRDLVDAANRGEKKLVIASRVPSSFMQEIQMNLKKNGIDLDCPVYTREEIEIGDKKRISYKDYSRIYEDLGINNPSKDAVVLGDFLGFQAVKGFSEEEYRNFDFCSNPEVLSSNYALNDHPLPVDEKETPLYVVLPQPWTCDESLDMDYAVDYLEQLYILGRNDFKKGLNLFLEQMRENQHVRTSDLAKRVLGKEIYQDYLVMKGRRENWKPLEVVMNGGLKSYFM